MNRLQKKCVIATAGVHLLLLTILIIGPAFFNPEPKPDNARVLDVIPASLIDAALDSGVRSAELPAPTPVVTPPSPTLPPTPPPPAPKPAVTPSPTFVDRVEKLFKSEPKPEPTKAVPKKSETHSHPIQVNTQLVTRTPSKNNSKPDDSRHDTQAINAALKNLRHDLSSSTEVNLSGDSSVAYANYGDIVVSVYHNAWIPPDEMDSDSVTVQFKVVIASDGTVLSASIIKPSGDRNVDDAVQRMLDRVKVIAPFPDGATEKERSYTINFNATRTTE